MMEDKEFFICAEDETEMVSPVKLILWRADSELVGVVGGGSAVAVALQDPQRAGCRGLLAATLH